MEICEKSREESKGGLRVMIVSLRNTTHAKTEKNKERRQKGNR